MCWSCESIAATCVRLAPMVVVDRKRFATASASAVLAASVAVSSAVSLRFELEVERLLHTPTLTLDDLAYDDPGFRQRAMRDSVAFVFGVDVR